MLATWPSTSIWKRCTSPKASRRPPCPKQSGPTGPTCSAAVTLVRRHGGAEALARLRLAIPRYNEATGVANTDTGGYHDTITVFYVWAVDRLVAAGLSTTAILWHPLASFEAVRSWYDPATLWSPAARRSFVPSTLALGRRTHPTRLLRPRGRRRPGGRPAAPARRRLTTLRRHLRQMGEAADAIT